jgi:hypothetical protein
VLVKTFTPAVSAKTALLFLLVAVLMLTLVQPAAYARETSRYVTVLEAKGTVTASLSGGFASLPVYPGMRLKEGDVLRTGAGSHAKLALSDREDEITLGENSEIALATLAGSGRSAITLFTLRSGSAWAHLEDRAKFGQGERFELRTPTAAFSAKGTHFLTSTDPVTGQTRLVVASGAVQAKLANVNNQQGGGPPKEPTIIYPTQQIVLGSRDEVSNLSLKVDFVDIEKLVQGASPSVIADILRNMAEINAENEALAEKLKKNTEPSGPSPSGNDNFLIQNAEDLDKFVDNLRHFLGNLALQAVKDKKVSKFEMDKLIEEVNRRIKDASKKLDLDKTKPLDPSAGLDPEVEKKKKQIAAEEEKKKSPSEEERERLLENQRRMADMLAKIEQDKKLKEEANRKALEEAKRKAEERLMAQLDEQARAMFEQNKSKNEQPSPPSNGTPSGPSSPSPTPQPDPVSEKKLWLEEAVHEDGMVTARLYMEDFLAPDDSVYAVEFHLLYDYERLAYDGGGTLEGSSDTVFGALPASVEVLKQTKHGAVANLKYAAVRSFDPADGSSLFVEGKKLLADVPLRLNGDGYDGLTVRLAYYKVLDADGNVLLDGSHLMDEPVEVAIRPVTESR